MRAGDVRAESPITTGMSIYTMQFVVVLVEIEFWLGMGHERRSGERFPLQLELYSLLEDLFEVRHLNSGRPRCMCMIMCSIEPMANTQASLAGLTRIQYNSAWVRVCLQGS